MSSDFKLSRYNFFLPDENSGKVMVFNALSNGLGLLEKETYQLLINGDAGIESLINNKDGYDVLEKLKKGYVIVNSSFDELEFLKAKFNMIKFSQPALGLTVVTTLDCNLRCQYCYQGEPPKKYADTETEDGIMNFIRDRTAKTSYKQVHVTWYGGEPLLNIKFIYSLSEKILKLCKEQHMNYQAMIVTNGTILNRAIVKKLKKYHVTGLQLTIDGPQEVHDKRRPFSNPVKSSYKMIMRNIESVLGIIPIQVRINVDKTNSEAVIVLLEEFEKRDWLKNSRDISFYIGYTRDWTTKCSHVISDCFSMREYSQAEISFQKLLLAKGMNLNNLYPVNRFFSCGAISPHSYVIDPGGELHKCWSDVGNANAYIGDVKHPVSLYGKLLDWLSFDPLREGSLCRECEFFPLCAGGCPYVAIHQKEKMAEDSHYNCTPWKILMREKIDVFLKSRIK